jgi:hypothetical protein
VPVGEVRITFRDRCVGLARVTLTQRRIGGEDLLQGVVRGRVPRAVLRPGIGMVLAQQPSIGLAHLGSGRVGWHPEFSVRVVRSDRHRRLVLAQGPGRVPAGAVLLELSASSRALCGRQALIACLSPSSWLIWILRGLACSATGMRTVSTPEL